MNERMIQNALYDFRHDHAVAVPNIQMRWGESDFLTINRNGFLCDHEIKISSADFKADFGMRGTRITSITKRLKHDAFQQGATQMYGQELPNYFYYVVPVELLTPYDMPSYAGLLYWHPSTLSRFGVITVIKKAPRLHEQKVNQQLTQKIARSLMQRYWKHRHDYDPACPGAEMMAVNEREAYD